MKSKKQKLQNDTVKIIMSNATQTKTEQNYTLHEISFNLFDYFKK